MVKINGENVEISDISLTEYVNNSNYDLKRIAIEINGIIIPKAQYDQTIIKNGDTIEVVSFVGGG